MRLAYIVTQYPKVSHTFIRREIQSLETLGHSVIRLSIRASGQDFVEEEDFAELKKTVYFLGGQRRKIAATVLLEVIRQPLLVGREILRSFRAGVRSEVGYFRNLLYVFEALFFVSVLRREKCEHVHAHFASNSTAVARIIHRLGGPSYSFTGHGRVMFDSPQSLDLKGKVSEAEFAIGVCDYTAAQMMRWSSLDDWGKIHVVRCTVSDAFFDRAQNIPAESKGIVCVGRLSEEKGQLLLLQAFANVAKDYPDATCVFVGDGPLRSEIEQRASRLGISDRVRLTGDLDEIGVSTEIVQSRALVVPSFMEGLPVVIMEAFALGRPVVATCISGIPELVRPGENGWLVPAGNTERLESAIRDVLGSPLESLEAMGLRGQHDAKQKHSVTDEAAKLEGLFRRYAAVQTSVTN